MASKNLGAVIQRAISDGAFRRQLQSDPAAALRGFNLTPDEVAAIRSGDSGKLMSLGVDQRMSKAFTIFGATDGATVRSTLADGTSVGSNAVIDSGSAGIHDSISGDPASASRTAFDPVSGVGREAISAGDTASTSDAKTVGNLSGTRALHEDAPADTGLTLNDPTAAQTRAINNTEPFEGGANAADSTGDLATRQVHNTEPFEGGANAADSTGDLATRQVNDTEPFEGTVSASAGAGELATRQIHDSEPSVASQMADANLADGTRALHDVDPADLGSSQVAASDITGGDIQHDAGDITGTSGNALSDTSGETSGPDGASHSWG